MACPPIISELVARYRDNQKDYRSTGYKEFRLRKEFLDPFFEALGWDVSNKAGYAEAYKDVVHEDSIRIASATKAPDYAFRVGGNRKFFCEAKVPSVDIKNDPTPAYQLRRYGWSAKLPLSILTDFEEFAVYDCRIRPHASDKASVARSIYIKFDEYESRWDEIESIFGNQAILKGAFDRYAQDATRKRGTTPVDEEFLAEIERWREVLAKNIALRNRELDVRELNVAVQRTIDRIVFLRIAEDRGFEPYGTLEGLRNGQNVYARLADLFLKADGRYNSGLFHFKPGDGSSETLDNFSLSLIIDDAVLRSIFSNLYPPDSPYEFSVLPADILGQIYEQFLGKVIRLAGRSAVVEEKPEVRKAGGVYYTPSYIVQHITEKTLGKVLATKSLSQAGGIDGRRKRSQPVRVLDPACGSGSFLIAAYGFLLRWYRDRYIKDGVEKHSKGREPRLYQVGYGEWHLTISEKKRILLTHIFGVDIDSQAVEVTKLSLLMMILEGEKNDALASQMSLFHMRALPDLGNNIRCGNSLIGSDIYDQQDLKLSDEEEIRINPFDWSRFLSEVTDGQGFDIIVGNPPYVLLQDENRQAALEGYIAANYAVATYKVDTYHLFVERALKTLKADGLFSFITPSNFLTNNHASGLRSLLLEGSHLSEIINFKGRVFDHASVDTCIFLIDRTVAQTHLKFIDARPFPSRFEAISEVSVPLSSILADKSKVIAAKSSDDERLLEHVEKSAMLLGRMASVNFGKQLRDRKKFKGDVIEISRGDSIPPGYVRCYTGKDIHRFNVVWGGLCCLTNRAAQSGGCWDDEKQNAKLKLLWKQIGRYPAFGIDERGYQCLNTIFMVNAVDTRSANFLLGILNSSVVKYYWLKKFYDHRDTFPKIKGTYLKQLPIPAFDPNNKLVQQIEACTRDLSDLTSKSSALKLENDRQIAQQKVRHLEERLNRATFELYGLSDEHSLRIEQFLANQAG